MRRCFFLRLLPALFEAARVAWTSTEGVMVPRDGVALPSGAGLARFPLEPACVACHDRQQSESGPRTPKNPRHVQQLSINHHCPCSSLTMDPTMEISPRASWKLSTDVHHTRHTRWDTRGNQKTQATAVAMQVRHPMSTTFAPHHRECNSAPDSDRVRALACAQPTGRPTCRCERL